MTSREILATGVELFLQCPELCTTSNVMNLRMAASLKWQAEEMGGLEHVQFALQNNTPVAPPGHCGHPTELVKRGFVDGEDWPEKDNEPSVRLSKYPDGNHWYAFVEGVQVIEGPQEKWNTPRAAEEAAKRFIAKLKSNEQQTQKR